jgi:hypothetical protein
MNKSNSLENDELVSAYLDGEVTEEERAFVENNPSLITKVKQMSAVIDATSALAHIDPSLREKHLTEAVSKLKKTTKLLPFRNKKSVQGGLALAALAAAAVAIFTFPVFDSQNKGSNNSDLVATGLINEIDNPNNSRNQVIEEQEMNETKISEAETTESTLSENEISQSTAKENVENAPLVAKDSISEEELDSSDNATDGDQMGDETPQIEESTQAASTNVEEDSAALSSNVFSFDPVNTYAQEDPDLSSDLLLINARTETLEESDLFIIELSDSLTAPSASASLLTPVKYAVEWTTLTENDNEENSLRGPQGSTEFLVINLAAKGIIWTDEDPGYVITWEPTDGLIQTDGGRINGIYNGSFEENLIFVLGADARYPFRVLTAADPPRLIVEIKFSQ